MRDNPATGIPENATVRQLYTDCGKCPKAHGPYSYAEWKVNGKVVTKYLGKGSIRKDEEDGEQVEATSQHE